jgi:predicted kinase
MERPTLYVIQGFLGSGKSTFSKALVDKAGAVRLNADEWCRENYSPEQLAIAWDECFANGVNHLWETAKDLLGHEQSVILDMGFWDISSRIHARQKASELNARLVHYYIYAPDDILMERLSKRSGVIARNNVKDFARLKKAFHEPEPHEAAIRIDNY